MATSKTRGNGNNKPRSNRGRNNKPKDRQKDFKPTDEEKFEGGDITNARNDISWYVKNPEMLKSAASLPFSSTVGLPMDLGDTAVPGVMALHYVPTFGPRIGYFEPINQAANSMYSFVVHANSRNQSYDAPDLMIAVLAGAQLFSMIGLGIRAYAVMRVYDQRNKYLPKALVEAMGFNFEDLKSNLSKMWFDINELIARSGQIWIPNTMPVIERWYWLNSNIYADASGAKAQYYLFTPEKAYKFSETAYDTGSALIDAGWNGRASNTWATYLSVINGMFDALLDSQDRGIMFGDILKAYGEDKLYHLTEIPSDYQIMPQFDTEVLTQIENSTSINVDQGNVFINSADNKIYCQADTAASEPSTAIGNFLPSKVILNFHKAEVPTPEEVMIATRLSAVRSFCSGGTSGQANWQAAPSCAGTEYIKYYMIWYFTNDGSLTKILGSSVLNTGSRELSDTDKWSAFDWAPWKYRFESNPSASEVLTALPNRVVGDFDHYTVVDYDTMVKMHTTATYSEFGVPTM